MGFHYVDSVGSTPYVPNYGAGFGSAPAPPAFNPQVNIQTIPFPRTEQGNSNSATNAPAANDDAPTAAEGEQAADNEQTTQNDSVDDLADRAHDAMYCAGTDDTELENVLNKINKDNVMDFMASWNSNHSSEKGESFMEAFMWDADSDQKVKFGRKIARALRDHAKDVGCYDDLADKFGEIDNELNSTCYINNDISDTYDEIISAIAAAEERENGSPNSCSDSGRGFVEDCKKHGIVGNTIAAVCGTVYGLAKGAWDLLA